MSAKESPGDTAFAATLNGWRTDDELRRARTVALGVAADVARDRGQLTQNHPGADAIIATAREFFDFIWSGK